MTSLTTTPCTPPHDTPAVRTLEPGHLVFAADCTVAEAEELEELLSDLVWRQQVRTGGGATVPLRKGA